MDLLRKTKRLDKLIIARSRNPTREVGKFRRLLPAGERSKHDFANVRDLICYLMRFNAITSADSKKNQKLLNDSFRALKLIDQRVHFWEKHGDCQKPEHVNLDLGQVFRHRIQGFRGVIIQWFPECPSSQAWIRDAGPFEHGLEQAFYRLDTR